jgi:hypothetical protein
MYYRFEEKWRLKVIVMNLYTIPQGENIKLSTTFSNELEKMTSFIIYFHHEIVLLSKINAVYIT